MPLLWIIGLGALGYTAYQVNQTADKLVPVLVVGTGAFLVFHMVRR